MTILDRFLEGDRRSLAKVITHIENRNDRYRDVLSRLYPRAGKSYRIGFTGPPGGGKSSVVDLIADHFLKHDKKIGIIAVDPSSPFSGGALLGDRIRMARLSNQENAYIRSMATRGSGGGLASASKDVCVVLDAFGFDLILVETVGVGQVELDIMDAVDTVVVVLVPESGDTIQAMKAGLMEIADIFCLNKSDREGADRMAAELNMMLDVRRHGSDWEYPVIQTSALKGLGIDELQEQIHAHQKYLKDTSRFEKRRRRQVKVEIYQHLQDRLREEVDARLGGELTLDEIVDEIAAGESDPFTKATEIFDKYFK
jgi:LAO/AO transport system kinase